MNNLDYIIIQTNKTSDIKHYDYILFDGCVYKIHLIKYQKCRKTYTDVTYKCRDFLETKNTFIKFTLDENFDEYIKFKKSISKIIFTVKNATFIDYNDNIISMLDNEDTVVDIKYNNYKPNEEQIIKYIKYDKDYKIIH